MSFWLIGIGILVNDLANPWPRKKIRNSTNRRSRGAQDVLAARPVMKLFIRGANCVWEGCSRREQGVRCTNCSVDRPMLRCFELCDVETLYN